MSDVGRKGFSDKASEVLKPDSQKNTLEKAQEKGTDYLDKFGKNIQPESDKGSLQKGADNASTEQKSFADQASAYLETAKGKVAEAADYVSDSLNKK